MTTKAATLKTVQGTLLEISKIVGTAACTLALGFYSTPCAVLFWVSAVGYLVYRKATSLSRSSGNG